MALAPDGSVYISDNNDQRIRKVDPNGIITTVAGTGVPGFSGDDGPAAQAQISVPEDVAVGSDGTLYIADFNNHRIRRVTREGIISTAVGTGQIGSTGDRGPATEATLRGPQSLAVDQDGSLYIADVQANLIRRVSPDGIITTVAGTGGFGPLEDGIPATQARLFSPQGVTLTADGGFLISEISAPLVLHRVRQVSPEGVINTVAGTATLGSAGDGGPATQAELQGPQGRSVAPDGSLYIAVTGRVRRVFSPLPAFSAATISIASEDGSELYQFDAEGRHLSTLNTLTGAVLFQFAYDARGFLTQITDGDGNVTIIERDASGNPTAIVAPFGQRTSFTLDPNGYLATISNPANETVQLAYSAEGLLETFTDPLGNPSQFLYDSLGRLTRDTDAAGGFQDLARSELESGFEVAKTTALNRTTGHRVERLTTGEQRRLTTFPEGTQTETIIGNDQSRALTFADGTTINTTPGPDPRFGMQTPITASETTTTPAGLISNINRERSVSLSDPADPLSLTSLTDTATVNGRIFTNVFDRTNLEFTLTSPEGRQTTPRIDNQGRVVEVSAGNLLPMRLEYDPLGRLTRAAQGVAGNERAISFSYDADGFLASITDAEGRTVSLSYDLAGRFTSQTLPDGRVIAYSYDANGNVTSITPPGQTQHIFAYTPVDLEGAYTPPDVGAGTNATQFFYNADRQLTQISRPDGQAIVFDYDTAGRRSLITLPRGSVQFNYDVNSGNQTTGTAPDGGILSFAYDGGLLTQESWTGEVSGSVTRAYDNDFRLTSLSVNGTGTVDLQYDNDNFLVTAGDLTLSRDAQNGLLIGSTLGGVSDSQTQNTFGEPTDYAASFSGAEVYSVQFTRDRLGRIVEKIETVEGVPTTFNYAYDLAGRLAEAKENGLVVATYTYDSNGNRLSLATPSGTITGSYDDQDRLTQYGSMSYTYTANGELLIKNTAGQTTSYDYGVLGNLLSVDLPNGTQIEYLIDARNRRIGKKVNGTLVQAFLYQDQFNPIAELDSSGNVTSRFVEAAPNSVESEERFRLSTILSHLSFGVHRNLVSEFGFQHPEVLVALDAPEVLLRLQEG